MLITLLLACGLKSPPQPPPEPVPVVSPPEPVSAPDQPVEPDARPGPNGLIRKLSIRDPEPSCNEVADGLADPAAELVHVAETVTMPPWVGMRAAACVASDHSAAAAEALSRWVTEPSFKGLGLVAVQHLDGMGEAVAVSVAEAALAGHLADDVRDDLASSSHAAVVELVAE